VVSADDSAQERDIKSHGLVRTRSEQPHSVGSGGRMVISRLTRRKKDQRKEVFDIGERGIKKQKVWGERWAKVGQKVHVEKGMSTPPHFPSRPSGA
jgi:hypothetical protein